VNSFLEGYYSFSKKGITENNYFEFYFEAIIEFL
jgi:hypothetical protein